MAKLGNELVNHTCLRFGLLLITFMSFFESKDKFRIAEYFSEWKSIEAVPRQVQGLYKEGGA